MELTNKRFGELVDILVEELDLDTDVTVDRVWEGKSVKIKFLIPQCYWWMANAIAAYLLCMYQVI